jgi:hypothetical protein
MENSHRDASRTEFVEEFVRYLGVATAEIHRSKEGGDEDLGASFLGSVSERDLNFGICSRREGRDHDLDFVLAQEGRE